MPVQGIWQNNRIGDPAYLGLTLGGVLEYTSSGSFVKADYPGLRAIRQDDDEPILAVDLAASTTITPAAGADGPRGTLGYAEVTAAQTGISSTITDLTDLAVVVNTTTGRRIKITAKVLARATVAGDQIAGFIREGSTTLQQFMGVTVHTANHAYSAEGSVVLSPATAARTYKLSMNRGAGSGTIDMLAAATFPAFILVEDITASTTRSIVELWY